METHGGALSDNRLNGVPAAPHRRILLMLLSFCCLSAGIAIGAVANGMAGATNEDNRLTISHAVTTPDSLSAAFARASETVEPSVVNIKVLENEFYVRQHTGSGVIVSQSGFVVTNQHVISRASSIKVRLANGNEYDAKVIGQDSGTDLAVIKIEVSEPVVVARIGDSDKLRVGDWVLAIGSPFGLEQTVTAGIVSAKDRVADANSQSPFQQFIQTDAAINPGNSGGPLVNIAGEVVGINTQIATNSGFNNGVGLALPSSTVVDVYNQLATYGRVRRGLLGIDAQEMSPQVARLNKIVDGSGVLVRDLTREGPAARGGLQSGDVITKVNGQKVKDVRDLIRRAASLPVGSRATINYVRNGEQRTTTVVLEERKEGFDESEVRLFPSQPSDLEVPPKPKIKIPGVPTLGISCKTLTPDLATLHGFEGEQGVYVAGVHPRSVADFNGVREDDLIVALNNRPVKTHKDFQRAAGDLRSGDDLVIRLLRKDHAAIPRSHIISFSMQ